ncbi:MAG: DUF751 family protein [Christensenellaceae bacterium]|nr:DUF751 family protein [Christensenellaceae bacterium]
MHKKNTTNIAAVFWQPAVPAGSDWIDVIKIYINVSKYARFFISISLGIGDFSKNQLSASSAS